MPAFFLSENTKRKKVCVCVGGKWFVQPIVLANLDIHLQNEIRSMFFTLSKINSNWIKNFNVRPQNAETTEKQPPTHWEHPLDTEAAKILMNRMAAT